LTPGPRMVDELECIASVLLAIVLAQLIGAEMIAWAAFSAFVLMKGHVSETLRRGVLRIIGTALGAALALLIVPSALHSLPVAALAAAVVGAIGLYGMLTAKRAYAWLLFGLTFEMILLENLEHPTLDASAFAKTRFLEVVAGTVACVAVSLLSTMTARKRWPGPAPARATRIGWHPAAARHAALAGFVLALLPFLHSLFQIPELEQAGITIMAVMIVPASDLTASGFVPVSRRLLQRMAGCVAGSLLAAAFLFSSQGEAWVLVAGTCVGIAIGRHIENGSPRMSYLGLQFTLAILIALVPDDYSDAAIRPAIERLMSIFIGMALLEPILLARHYLLPEKGTFHSTRRAFDVE
jgi:uncharacterized membrane protein YccC